MQASSQHSIPSTSSSVVTSCNNNSSSKAKNALIRSKSYDSKLNYNNNQDTSIFLDEDDDDDDDGSGSHYASTKRPMFNNHKYDDHSNDDDDDDDDDGEDDDDNDYKYGTNISKNKDTKIIVTSFAPDPKAKSYMHIRPASYATATAASASSGSNSQVAKADNDNGFNRNLNLAWVNGKSNLPLIIFSAKVLRKTCWECKKIGEQYRLTYKFHHGEKKLIKGLLDGHGFRETHPNSSEFNLIWSGSNLKSYSFRSLQENQKVNHFPRSCELTRKDRLFKNIQKMQKEKGLKAFNFVPITFIMPFEIDDFYTTFYKEKGLWIVKPASLSRGRGIFLISHPDQIPLDDNLVVSRYLSNPLLIEGFKFDLRLYVAVTSFDPLVFYLYEEGLTRFATIKYDQSVKNIKNTCMHLTNYSLNKKNDKYVRCNDPDIEDYGNKWSMSALLRFLSNQGKDTFSLMMNIEEVIIKTLLSVESPLASAARMFMPFRGNCFELFGFDVLIDEFLKPWVLEVNLSPSLDCDALLDIRIKSSMVADLFTLTGIYCQNPSVFSTKSRQSREQFKNKNDFKIKVRPHSASNVINSMKQVPNSNNNLINSSNNPLYDGLSQTEQSIVKTVIQEEERSNGWIRLFPTSDTWEYYSQFLETRSTSFNMTLHKKLFPRRWQFSGSPKKATQSRAKILETAYESYKDGTYSSSETSGVSLMEALERYKRYERKLVDSVRPNEDTLKKLSAAPHLQQPTSLQNQKPILNGFPIGETRQRYNNMINNQNCLSDITLNGEESSNNSLAESGKVMPSRVQSSTLHNTKRQLPTINSTNNFNANSTTRANSVTLVKSTSTQNRPNSYVITNPSTKTKSDENNNQDNVNDDDNNSEYDQLLLTKEQTNGSSHPMLKYELENVLKYLEDGYYLSRIQIRNAFALYLFKIQVRLVAESNGKDDSNLQQMDLVIRFIKKAAPNLSQEFKVYVPSKRLPLNEQKRMLAKQLHDFLHVYRKDTEQIRIEMRDQLENERKKYRRKLIDEKLFQALLYRCCESELEEIMSVYMKNSQDSSVFLGGTKSSFTASTFNSNLNANSNNVSTPVSATSPSSNSNETLTNQSSSSNNFTLTNKTPSTDLNSNITSSASKTKAQFLSTNLQSNTSNIQNHASDLSASNNQIESLTDENLKSSNKSAKQTSSNTNNVANNSLASTKTSNKPKNKLKKVKANKKMNTKKALKKDLNSQDEHEEKNYFKTNKTSNKKHSGDELSNLSFDSHSSFSTSNSDINNNSNNKNLLRSNSQSSVSSTKAKSSQLKNRNQKPTNQPSHQVLTTKRQAVTALIGKRKGDELNKLDIDLKQNFNNNNNNNNNKINANKSIISSNKTSIENQLRSSFGHIDNNDLDGYFTIDKFKQISYNKDKNSERINSSFNSNLSPSSNSKNNLKMNTGLKSANYETIITNIYLNSNARSITAKVNSNINNTSISNNNVKGAKANGTPNFANLNRPVTSMPKKNVQTLNRSSSSNGLLKDDQLNLSKTNNNYNYFDNNTQIFKMNKSNSIASNSDTTMNNENHYLHRDYFNGSALKSTQMSANNSGYDEEQALLLNGLKSLAIKQQERIYSAAKSSFRLGTSLVINDSSNKGANNLRISLNSVSPSLSHFNANELNQLNSANASTLSSNNHNMLANKSLISKLERQKEETSKLLEKSKAKHNEMISMTY